MTTSNPGRGLARRQFRPEFAPLQADSWILFGLTLVLVSLTLAQLLLRW